MEEKEILARSKRMLVKRTLIIIASFKEKLSKDIVKNINVEIGEYTK
jgi:hypothetical protein